MALPVIQASQGVPTIAGRGRVDPAATSSGARELAKAAGRTSDILFDMAEREQGLRDTVDLAKASAAATRELDEYRVELDKDPDYATKADRFKKKAEEVKGKFAGRFGATGQARFDASYETLASGMELSVRHGARKDERQQGLVTLDTTNDDLVGKAANARNILERDGYLGQINDNLTTALENKTLTAAEHGQRKRAVLSKFEEVTAQQQIRTAPAAALKELADPAKFTYLDPIRREALKGQAQGRLETLGAQARIDARLDAGDMQQSWRDGIPPEDYDKRLAKVKAIDPRAAARVESEKSVADSVSNFRTKPLTEQSTILREYETKIADSGLSRDQRFEFERMMQVHQRTVQLFANDAFGASLSTSRAVRGLFDAAEASVEDPKAASVAREASLDWQAKNGVGEMDRAVVSRNTAKQLARELATLDGQAFDQRLKEIRAEYGDAHFKILRRQLEAEGKDVGKISGFGTALELPDTPVGTAARANLVDAGKIKQEDLKKIYAKDDDIKTARAAIETELADLKLSLGGAPGGMRTMARYVDDAERLTAFHVMSGKSVKDAAKLAAQQLVNAHFAFIPDRGDGRVRVPLMLDGAAVPVSTVRDNLEAAREALPSIALQVPHDATPGADQVKAATAFARRLQSYGRWMTLEGGRGAVLTYEANGRIQPVLQKDGKPVAVFFNEARRAKGETTPADVPAWYGAPGP